MRQNSPSSPRPVSRSRFRVVVTAALATSALALAFVSPAAAANDAMVRVLHASYDAPAVDVYVDGTKALSSVPFKTISDYLPVPAGEHTLAIRAAGTSTDVISAKATVAAGQRYTVAAIDPLASIKFKVLEDDPAPVSGSAAVRIVHLSPDAPAVDVAVKGQSAAEAPVKNLAYGAASAYLDLPAASYDFEVRPTGTTDVALALPGVALAAGTAYSVFAVGSVASTDAATKLGVVLATDAMVPPPTSTVGGDDAGFGGAAMVAAIVAALAMLAVAGAMLIRRRAAVERVASRRSDRR